tara:strand:- start:81878 stop:82147 length:270 start_codon:yes stop_codon:yes gene_type:complete
MEILLIVLGILGFGAIVIAAYVFTVAARNYVSDDSQVAHREPTAKLRTGFVMRDPKDRRRNAPAEFPLTVNSVLISRDRRELPDRRAAA